ncbi:UMP kinase [Candidatus Falkowbacteria bacterium]|nr:UMP kinase [Candidatus Falkowbacteria bacterium]
MNNNSKGEVLVISLGGSAIVPDEVDTIFLKKFREFIFNFIKNGGRAVIVAGGGGTNKKYNQAAQKVAKIKNIDLDWLGIAATKLNAELLRVILGEKAYEKVVVNPTVKIKTNKKIIVAAGWQPGCSSDKDAVLWAKSFGAKRVVNLTNIDYVYDKDPHKFSDARPLKNLKWAEYRKMVGNKWIPRMHAPFDPIASQLAEKWGMEVVIMRGSNLVNFRSFLQGKEFRGSILG